MNIIFISVQANFKVIYKYINLYAHKNINA